nr:manganese catalase family protein [Microlunatus sp. Gsoil 973]
MGAEEFSGDLLAGFYANANAEMPGRIQFARLYHPTDDPGVKDLLSFLLARDTMHQNQIRLARCAVQRRVLLCAAAILWRRPSPSSRTPPATD